MATPEHLPAFWDQSVVFFANLLALFYGNEEETAVLSREIGNVESYGGRLIPVLDILFAGGQNTLVLEQEPEAALCAYFKDTLGLRLPELRLMKHATYERLGQSFESGSTEETDKILSGLEQSHARLVDGYVTDPTLAGIASHLAKQTASTMEGSHCGNNKWLLHKHIEEAGLPVPATETAASVEDVSACLERLTKQGFRHAVVKSQIGASGIGIQKVVIEDYDSASIPEMMFYEGPCMVQGWLEPGLHGIESIKSPSVQLFLDPERVCMYDMTEQILSHDSVHEGNESPPPYLDERGQIKEELLRQAEIAGQWLHTQGYRGTASVDFLLAYREGKLLPTVYICEINARVTGATYPSVLARHFQPGCSWLMRNLKFIEPVEGQRLLDLLEEAKHLFKPESSSGILPVNFNLAPSGLVTKGQFLCIGQSGDVCHRYLTLAETDLPIDWDYVRD